MTRPEDAGTALTHTLTELGATVIHESMFHIESASSDTYAKQLTHIKPDLMIVTSVFAVKTAGTYISKHHKSWLAKVPIIGIGPATAGALHEQGWRDVSYPKVFNSEGILDMRMTSHVRHKTIVILTGAHGRNLLTPALSERGAKVLQVDGYERRALQQISGATLNLLAKSPVIVVLTSVEAWQTLDQLATQHQVSLSQAVFVVVSKRIAETIWKKHREQRILVTNQVGNEAIVAAILSFKEAPHE